MTKGTICCNKCYMNQSNGAAHCAQNYNGVETAATSSCWVRQSDEAKKSAVDRRIARRIAALTKQAEAKASSS